MTHTNTADGGNLRVYITVRAVLYVMSITVATISIVVIRGMNTTASPCMIDAGDPPAGKVTVNVQYPAGYSLLANTLFAV